MNTPPENWSEILKWDEAKRYCEHPLVAYETISGDTILGMLIGAAILGAIWAIFG